MILLGERDNEEHLQVLQTVFRRAQDHGITFNKEKCEFEKEEIEFFGHGEGKSTKHSAG